MHPIPEDFRRGPVSRAAALSAGIPRAVLEGPQFHRLHEAVYCHRDHALTFDDRVTAAHLALPPTALTTGITRLQELGFGHGARTPLHFVVEGDLHLSLDGVFLHRTVMMPPHGEDGVTVEAAFVAYCAEARVIDAIKGGSLLAHRGQLRVAALEELVVEQRWRRGALEAAWVLPHLDGRCRSLPEGELLGLLSFSGLPVPDVNQPVELAPGELVTPDLWYAAYRQAVEYEGSQHQEDRAQYNADIDRYALYRRSDVGYLQVTKERMRTPAAVVRTVHRALVGRGYDGPAPELGELWRSLFGPLADVVPARFRHAA